MLLGSKIKGFIVEEKNALVPSGFPDMYIAAYYEVFCGTKVLAMFMVLKRRPLSLFLALGTNMLWAKGSDNLCLKVPKKLFLVLTGCAKKMLRL